MLEIYGASWCAPCGQAKRYLDRKGIPYNYNDIDADPVAKQLVLDLGYSSVPVFVSGEEHWQGFDRARLDALK